MEGSGNYIGTPCAVILCVDKAKGRISGELYHGYSGSGIPFNGVEDAFLIMEDFYDRLRYPFPGTESRSFIKKKPTNGEAEMTRMMGDAELLKKHGDRGTFIVRVQHRQHSSWQGVVTWTEEQKTIPFRSALELLKLIDGALDEGDSHRNGADETQTE